MNSEQIRKTTNLLTICVKAGKTVKGFDTVCEAVKNGTAACVMTASDISEKSLKETAFVCGKYDIPIIETGLTKEELRGFLGKQTAVLGVCDKGFADGFRKIAETEKNNYRIDSEVI